MDNQSNLNCKVFSLNHLAIFSVSGEDSAKFLQGQLSCDVYNLSESQSSIAAFCNPKGRVISTLIIIKTAEAFLLIVPACLLDKVITKLQMYVLRSAVRLSNQTMSLHVFGFDCEPANGFNPPTFELGSKVNHALFIKLPSSRLRYLCIADQAQIDELPILQNHTSFGNSDEWRFQDILSGFPWFDESQSEQYIPQMLNIDRLDGISFNKGCYTGQEIIARTHYLGKAKRTLFLAECYTIEDTPANGISILDSKSQQTVGSVLNALTFSKITRMLVVLQEAEANSDQLVLDDAKRTTIKILPIQ